jgi:hypothetical protein
MSHKICTCEWSTVNTATVDPPHIVWPDPHCHFHGLAAISDAAYARDAEDEQRKQDAAEGFDE